jgi:hypothetical protein
MQHLRVALPTHQFFKIITLYFGPAASSDVFFSAEFSPNFKLKKMISTYIKDFSWKKMTQIYQIYKTNSILSDFYDKFQQ